METLEELLQTINGLEGEERELVVGSRIHDFNNLITTITGFSNLLHIDVKYNLPLETHDWTKNVDLAAKQFNESLNCLAERFDVEEMTKLMKESYDLMTRCPPEEFLDHEKAVTFRK